MAPAIGSIDILEDGLIGIDSAGRIASVLTVDDRNRSLALAEYCRCLGRRSARRRLCSVIFGDAGHDDETVQPAHAPHPAAERRVFVVLNAEIAA